MGELTKRSENAPKKVQWGHMELCEVVRAPKNGEKKVFLGTDTNVGCEGDAWHSRGGKKTRWKIRRNGGKKRRMG